MKFQELEYAKTDLLFNFELISQESKLGCFHEGIGVCEQIMGTPIPLSYTRLTSRFLVLWHLTLPVILWDDCHWIVVPATFISAASLFCIEEVITLFALFCIYLHSRIKTTHTHTHILSHTLLLKLKSIMQVGVLIEEPFPMLALDDLCHRLRSNIDDVMRHEKLIQARVSENRKRSYSKEHSPNGWPNS